MYWNDDELPFFHILFSTIFCVTMLSSCRFFERIEKITFYKNLPPRSVICSDSAAFKQFRASVDNENGRSSIIFLFSLFHRTWRRVRIELELFYFHLSYNWIGNNLFPRFIISTISCRFFERIEKSYLFWLHCSQGKRRGGINVCTSAKLCCPQFNYIYSYYCTVNDTSASFRT